MPKTRKKSRRKTLKIFIMSINMQGTWLVKVKSKEAAFAQQFKIEGAGIYDGTYTGSTATPEVFVTAPNWAITILNNPGSGFVPSEMQIKFPVQSGGFYSFDIQSDDIGGDKDFNDLILTCRTPVASNDYIIYGNVGYYAGLCINPCWRDRLVIDSVATLKQTLLNPSLRELISAYYPERVAALNSRANYVSLNPQPLPPNPGDPFKTMMIPLDGSAPIPPKQKSVVRSRAEEMVINANTKEAQTFSFSRLLSSEKINAAQAVANTVSVSDKVRIDAAGVAARFRYNCETGSLPSAILNVKEYDRSTAELSGAPFTGDGSREQLGQIIADRNGNYIFRFTMTDEQTDNEIDSDTAPGETASSQRFPDVMLQLMCLGNATPIYETVPYWNIDHLKRIDLCVPKEKSCLIPLACDGQHIIQGIGNIVLGAPNLTTNERIGSNNFLNANGIITSRGSLGPQTRCAAWYGTLLMRGCLNNKLVKYYKLWVKENTLFAPYIPFTQPFSLPKQSGANIIESQVYDSTVGAYLNVENDAAGNWLVAYRNIKAKINCAAFANGSYRFKIEGYDADMNFVNGTDERVRLYIDNGNVTADLKKEISMEGVGELGECALFTLPADSDTNVPGLTVKFRAVHNLAATPQPGFMNSYGLSMQKGASGFSFIPGSEPATTIPLNNIVNSGRTYVHGDDLICSTSFQGTYNEPGADANGYYSATLKPASGNWLEPGQTFCAFSITLSHQLRLTDGQGVYAGTSDNAVLIGIQRP